MFGAAVMALLFFPAALVLGRAALILLYGKGKRDGLAFEDAILTGGLLIIGLAEGAHLGALAYGQSVSVAQMFFLLLFGGMVGISAVILGLNRLLQKKGGGGKPAGKGFHVPAKEEGILLAVLLGMMVLQAMGILLRSAVYQDFDMTLETVVTFLKEDRLYGSNPMTGMPYQAGMPSRLKILCLPTLYAVCSRVTGAAPEVLIWHVIPLLVLILSYLAYFSLARTLFEGKVMQELLFLLFVGVLFWVGDAMYGLEGFGLFHAGFQGTAIRSSVILPYLFGACLRGRWKLVILAILAEACIVWTLYGAGMGLLMALAFLIIGVIRKRLLDGRRAS